ncbi:hypothetical protein EDF57_11226 [Novosphingobium sp. PhB55]|nr:hypothetical protein EDF57_11226 [Novosphingobium sp. PhB55]
MACWLAAFLPLIAGVLRQPLADLTPAWWLHLTGTFEPC